MAFALQMDPDLMGAPGLEAAFDQGHGCIAPQPRRQRPHVGARSLAERPVDDRHAGAQPGVAADRRIDGHRRRDRPRGQGKITARHRALCQLPGQRRQCAFAGCDDHQTGGVLVEAVHDACAGQHRQRRPVMQQAIEQRAPPVSRGRMHDQTGLLVDHQHIGVFMDDVQWYRVGLEGLVRFARQHPDLQRLEAGQPRRGLQRALCTGDRPEGQPVLQPRAREPGYL
jgi:hypothetical protein